MEQWRNKKSSRTQDNKRRKTFHRDIPALTHILVLWHNRRRKYLANVFNHLLRFDIRNYNLPHEKSHPFAACHSFIDHNIRPDKKA
jgi:hypothetical protein